MAGDTQSNLCGHELRSELQPDVNFIDGEDSEVINNPEEKTFALKINENIDKSLEYEQAKLCDITLRFGLVRENFYELMKSKGLNQEENANLERIETICEVLDLLVYSSSITGSELTQLIDELEGIYDEL